VPGVFQLRVCKYKPCDPANFRRSLPSNEANTVEWAGFKGKKNGDLLRAAEIAGYTVLLTVDQGMAAK